MIAGGLAVLAGWSPKLPMPGGRAASGGGIGAVYGLGVFSGIAERALRRDLARRARTAGRVTAKEK